MQAGPVELPGKRRLAMVVRLLRALVYGPGARTVPALETRFLPPMRGRVEILRDRNGVPHIYAEQEPDLFAALGYLQGADRFVTLDVMRHLGAGRLCELIGNFAIPTGNELFSGRRVGEIDRFVRPLDFETQSERDYQRLSDRAANCAEAFANGMNAALRAMNGVYPVEFALLGTVRPWRPSDALLMARACAFVVSLGALDIELIFDAVRGGVGDEAARRFFPDAPWEHVPTSYIATPGSEPEPPMHLPAGGSNNWAVNAARSASGAPIVANDPHVPLGPLPTFWYHAHLECPSYRVQGGLMLGCPIFGYGHNGHLAWGVTTAYRDAWDLYRIHRLPGDTAHYRTLSGHGTITAHRETRRTHFGRDLVLEWESCEHGIIYPDWKHHDGTDLALRLVSSDLAAYFDGYLALAQSTSVAEHQRALAQINDGPFDFNHVYGHTDGHIAWEQFGRVPRRAADGLFVRDADDPLAQWDGFVPFAAMPKVMNPARGYVASANSLTDPENFQIATTRVHVEPRYRQQRIEAALAAGDRHSVTTFAVMQGDVGSDYGAPLRDVLRGFCAGFAARTDTLGAAYHALAAWDGAFDVDSKGAPLLWLTQQELAKRVFMAVLGLEVGRRYLSGRRAVVRLQQLLWDPADPLHHDIARASGRPFGELVCEAFVAAVSYLVEHCGPDPQRWQWGNLQRIRLGTVLGEVPLLGRLCRALDTGFPGDLYTVSPAVSVPMGNVLRVIVGASSRFICDLATPNEAFFAHSSGPSGDVGSAFFKNLTPAWSRGEYFRSALWKPQDVPDVVERLVIDPAH